MFMHDVIKKTFELIDVLDDSDIIKNITKYKGIIENNSELKKLIDKGNSTLDKYVLMDIKNRLYKVDEYREYMHYYNELMYIVMDINSKYKEIISERSCYK